MSDSEDKKDRALYYAQAAYKELQEAGMAEQYLSLLHSVVTAKKGAFFVQFGNSEGFFLEFEPTNNILTPLKINFGTRHYPKSLFLRMKLFFRSFGYFFSHSEKEYEIHLTPQDITKLKDLLRLI